jgi:F-type H+-transporting ATPase subunit delta
MKISKSATAAARRLFGLCFTDDRLDEAKLRAILSSVATSQPRDFKGILTALQRLTRLDQHRREVLVESAVELDDATRQRVISGLTQQYGAGLVAQYQITPSLLGGLRIRVGDDVFDGSVQNRLARLAAAF